jgi:hypothetical protein
MKGMVFFSISQHFLGFISGLQLKNLGADSFLLLEYQRVNFLKQIICVNFFHDF